MFCVQGRIRFQSDGGLSRLRFDCQRSKCSGAESSGASAASMGTVSICSGARSVYSGADSVYSGMLEVRMSVLLSGALCSTGAASSALTVEKDSAGAFACGRELCWAVLNEDSRTR